MLILPTLSLSFVLTPLYSPSTLPISLSESCQYKLFVGVSAFPKRQWILKMNYDYSSLWLQDIIQVIEWIRLWFLRSYNSFIFRNMETKWGDGFKLEKNVFFHTCFIIFLGRKGFPQHWYTYLLTVFSNSDMATMH